MNTNFYGGERNAAFVIKAQFQTIDAMVAAFRMGPDYTQVNFDEYVIINTVTHNDKDNGKIFRRGYDYTNVMGGAELLGHIVGPDGLAPMMGYTRYDNLEEDTTWRPENPPFPAVDQPEYIIIGQESGSLNLNQQDLVPGKVGLEIPNTEYAKSEDLTFNDEIQWRNITFRDVTNHDCAAYIGVKMPYSVVDYVAESTDAYYNRDDTWDTISHRPNPEKTASKEFKNLHLINRDKDEALLNHPFYEKWDIKIPKGIKGSEFVNFRKIVPNTQSRILTTSKPGVAQEDPYGQGKIDIYNNCPTGYNYPTANYQNDIDSNREIFVIDYINYDRVAEGDKLTLYLGDYNVLKENGNFEIAEDGTLTIHYTHDDPTILEHQFNWINDIQINTDNGSGIAGTGDQKVWITYNNDNISQNGTKKKSIGNPINYIVEQVVTNTDHHLLVWYSDPEYRKALPEPSRDPVKSPGLYSLTYPCKRSYKYDKNSQSISHEDWADLGPVKDQNGILIGAYYTDEDIRTLYNTHFPEAPIEPQIIPTTEQIIALFNILYPNGLGEANTEEELPNTDLQGKIITVGNEKLEKRLFAFDYRPSQVVADTEVAGYTSKNITQKEKEQLKTVNGHHGYAWYYLGSLNDNNILTTSKDDINLAIKKTALPVQGVWLITEPIMTKAGGGQ